MRNDPLHTGWTGPFDDCDAKRTFKIASYCDAAGPCRSRKARTRSAWAVWVKVSTGTLPSARMVDQICST